MINVEVNGQRYDEMHVDGGATRQSFLFHLSKDEDAFQSLNIVGRGRAFLIHNAKLESNWKTVDRKILPIAVRSASAMILSNGSGDLYREYLSAQKFDFDCNLAYISSDFGADENELFDRIYMRKLYDFAYESAVNGYPWKKFPPALKTM